MKKQMNKDREEINRLQQEFYNSKKKNLPTRIWSYFRNGSLNKIKRTIGVERDVYELHKRWLGPLKDKKVLDLGCFEGNNLSIYLAMESREYLGIDLSNIGIEKLKKRLKDIPGARAEVKDFLSEDFNEKDFDLIYAYGVLHHFKDVDELIARLREKLNDGGRIISYDPLQTSLPIKILRQLYRPFQSDKAWEWPFSKQTLEKFQQEFMLIERRGVLGKTKWAALVNLVPGSRERKEELTLQWHREDWERSAVDDKALLNCMHLSMLLQKRN